MTENHYITVLGLGNILLQDEGFGVHFVRRLADKYRFPPPVRVIEGGTLAYALLETVCDCSRLIVIDVLKTDDEPGTLYRFTKEELELHLPPPTSAHEVQFQDVLVKAELLGEAPEVVFLCVAPEAYGDFNLAMTPRLYGRMDEMERMLLEELASLGIHPERVS